MRPASSNSCHALATEDWFGIVSIRIQRPSTRIWFTALKLCEPPETCITASVRPCVGRIAPIDSGIQSICAFITPVIAPWRSGLVQTWPSDHRHRSRSSCTLGCDGSASSGSGRPLAWNTRVSQPKCRSRRSASSVAKRLQERSRSEP